jgi:hypothetical protein
MRPDFPKLLTERERHHHDDHYHNYRHVKGPKGLNDDEVGGRESMRKRFNFGYDRKQFNENLNPLYGWLRAGVGKNWDKYYGQLRKQFDARKVINAHILEHLFRDVEIHTHVGDKGQVMFMDTRYTNKGEQPIAKCTSDYYVCPKSGCLRKTHKEPRRSIVKEQEARAEREKLETFRQLDEHNVLRLIDGIWYHFELKPIPKVSIVYHQPFAHKGDHLYQIGYQFLGQQTTRNQKIWNELNEFERKQHGTARVEGTTGRDLFTNDVVYIDQKNVLHQTTRAISPRSGNGWTKTRPGFYHATKATASHKQLKQAGLAK